MKQETIFWLNGKYLNINSLDLAQYVQSFPEPVPFKLIRGPSFTDELPVGCSVINRLASSWCLWTATLKDELLNLMKAAFQNHEVIIVSLAAWNETSAREELRIFSHRMSELWLIIETLDNSPPLSVWATTEDEVEASVNQFESNSEPWFERVMNFHHIKHELRGKEVECGKLKSQVRHFEATFNKYKKDQLRTSKAEASSRARPRSEG